MIRLLSTALLVSSVASLGTAASLSADVETRQSYSASAFDLEDGKLLYVERHVETWRAGRLSERQVSYEDAAGRPIAEKVVRYGEAPEAPSFEMIDFRLGLREGAAVTPDEIALFSGPVERRVKTRTLARPSAAVVDAGFDAFMRSNFSTVKAGEPLEFDFAVPALRRFFRFELLPQGEVSYEGKTALSVKMRPASAFLRLLVDPIELVYAPDGRLLEFQGLANVWDEEGERYEARIVFDYPPTTASAAAEVAP